MPYCTNNLLRYGNGTHTIQVSDTVKWSNYKHIIIKYNFCWLHRSTFFQTRFHTKNQKPSRDRSLKKIIPCRRSEIFFKLRLFFLYFYRYDYIFLINKWSYFHQILQIWYDMILMTLQNCIPSIPLPTTHLLPSQL